MAIQVRCSCGKKLQVDDAEAGGTVRCPSCRERVSVPDEPEESSGYGVAKVRKCPRCSHEWPPDTAICIDCGHNFETGRKLRTKVKIPDRVVVDGITWLGLYTRYRVFRGKRGQACLNVSRRFLFIPTGNDTYDLSRYDAILTDFEAGDGENPEVYYLQLDGARNRAVTIFKSSNEGAFRDLTDLLAQAGRLQIKRK